MIARIKPEVQIAIEGEFCGEVVRTRPHLRACPYDPGEGYRECGLFHQPLLYSEAPRRGLPRRVRCDRCRWILPA